MSLKAELEAWAAALKAYDEEDFEQSLEIFSVCLRFSPSLPVRLTFSRRALPTLQKFLQIWASSTQLSASMKLPCSSSSPPPVLTTTWLSRQYPYLPDFLRLFFITINSSYFQCGVSNFLLGRYDRSSKDFEEALLYLRGNQSMYAT
jgi:tetratricopeptide (TPR) repeat protein